MMATPFKWITHRWNRKPARDSRQTLKDRALAYRLYWTFERDLELAALHGIHVYVQHGTATLYGTIRHELDRTLLVSLVQQVTGINGVIEHLQIAAQPSRESETEIMIGL